MRGIRRPHGCGAASVGSRVYAFGGEDTGVLDPGPSTLFDTASGKVEEVAAPPAALQSCAGVACGCLVYSLGGWDVGQHACLSDVYAYVTDIDRWVAGPALPAAARGVAAAEHTGCIYALEGDFTQAMGTPLLMLDPRSRAWSGLPAMPSPVVGGAHVAVVSGRLYMPGGVVGAHEAGGPRATMQCYDMVAGRWDTGCAPMAEVRQCHGVAAVSGEGGSVEVWSVGGVSALSAKFLSSVEIYNPRLNTWRSGVRLPHACGYMACTMVTC